MPYCVKCGNGVGDADQFCAKCGARQSGAARRSASDAWTGMTPRNAIILCYIPWVGWVGSIAVLASERFRRNLRVRFHAFQGLYLFIAWLLVEWVVSPAMRFPGVGPGPMRNAIPSLIQVAILIAWIFMLIKVAHDEDYRLPIIGELADRSASEQSS